MFENIVLKFILHLTFVLCYAVARTRIKRKRFCVKISQNLFYSQSELTPCHASPRGVSWGVGRIVTPHAFWFIFATEKEHVCIYSSSLSMSGVSSPSSIETFLNFFAMICVRFDAPSMVSVASSSFF